MGKFEALTWLISLTIYFVFFITLVSSVGDNVLEDYVDFDFSNAPSCTQPRFKIGVEGEEIQLSNNPSITLRNCNEYTRAWNDETSCNMISGCSWKNETIRRFWFDIEEGCHGKVDYWEIANTSSTIKGSDVCYLDNVIDDEEMCELLGCSWTTTNPNELNHSPRTSMGLVSTVSSLFSFSYDFGLSGLLNSIVHILFFYLPLIMFIGSIYFLMPIIH